MAPGPPLNALADAPLVKFGVLVAQFEEQKVTPMKCGRTGCEADGLFYIEANVWAKGYGKRAPPVTGVIGVQMCKVHADEAVANSTMIITDEFWAAIDDITRSARLVPVDRKTLELRAVRGNGAKVIDNLHMAGTDTPPRGARLS